MSDTRSSDEKQKQKDVARDERKKPGVEKMLRQFMQWEAGLGKTDNYRRRHEFALEWPEAKQKELFKLMDIDGMSFDQAFDKMKEGN